MENLLFLGVPILKHIRVLQEYAMAMLSNSYTMVCLPVRGEKNPQGLASGLSPIQIKDITDIF